MAAAVLKLGPCLQLCACLTLSASLRTCCFQATQLIRFTRCWEPGSAPTTTRSLEDGQTTALVPARCSARAWHSRVVWILQLALQLVQPLRECGAAASTPPSAPCEAEGLLDGRGFPVRFGTASFSSAASLRSTAWSPAPLYLSVLEGLYSSLCLAKPHYLGGN